MCYCFAIPIGCPPQLPRASQMMSWTLLTWLHCFVHCASSKPSTPTRQIRNSTFTMLCVSCSVRKRNIENQDIIMMINNCQLLCSGLGNETSEKQAPSALDFVGIFQQAVEAHRKVHAKVSLQNALNQCIAQYNKTTSVKKWRVDTLKRKIVANLLKVPPQSIEILAEHYDMHRHTASGKACYLHLVACGFCLSLSECSFVLAQDLLLFFILMTTY